MEMSEKISILIICFFAAIITFVFGMVKSTTFNLCGLGIGIANLFLIFRLEKIHNKDKEFASQQNSEGEGKE